MFWNNSGIQKDDKKPKVSTTIIMNKKHDDYSQSIERYYFILYI